MKKFGFTLAEILVSLGIIGVISALTMPTLFVNTSSAKIGPTLSKAVSAFEQANIMMLNDAEADSLTDANFTTAGNHFNSLSRHLKGSRVEPVLDRVATSYRYISKDGIRYAIYLDNGPGTPYPGLQLPDSTIPHQNGIGTVAININGSNAFPEVASYGSEEFLFTLWDDGSLRPVGAANWNGNMNSGVGLREHWSNEKCPLNGTVSDARYCAGHIFENNLKVNYKL